MKSYPENKDKMHQGILIALKQLEDHINKNLTNSKNYLVSNNLTYADFMWFQFINFTQRWSSKISENEVLMKWMERVRTGAGEKFREYDEYVNGNVYFVPPGFSAIGGCFPNQV